MSCDVAAQSAVQTCEALASISARIELAAALQPHFQAAPQTPLLNDPEPEQSPQAVAMTSAVVAL
jgi:hypothetical protein